MPQRKQKGKAKTKGARYVEAQGQRKTARARVRLILSPQAQFIINTKPLEEYFQDQSYQMIAREALEKGSLGKTVAVTALVQGGGLHAQAEAVRHGIARALVKMDPAIRTQVKSLGFLTRDPRMRERKKFGLKRARRARQWRKR